ncbi:uncharacterized protein Sptz isoform X2 [Prorops nasuta]|uniref:uncharacterized protein Sptz isoform X2 n=1 Tax=Prorops nasuta TaxID=863751 RepID=UPI0034CF544F
MSQQMDNVLDLEKYISSRLWYTALIIYRNFNKATSFNKEIKKNFSELETKIKSTIDVKNENPHTFLAYQLFSNIFPKEFQEMTNNVNTMLDHILFTNAIQLLEIYDLNEDKQELINLYSNALKEYRYDAISQPTFMLLHNNLQTDPALICWIINRLHSLNKINCKLPNIYFCILQEYLVKYEQLLERFNTNYLGVTLSILSKMDIADTEEIRFFNWLFPILANTYNHEDIELALYSRKSLEFLHKWYKFLDNLIIRNTSTNTLQKADQISKVLFKFEENKFSLCGKELITRMITQKSHWIIDILDLCSTFTRNVEYEKVLHIMMCSTLKYFWPVLLLQVFNQCSNQENNSNTSLSDFSICQCLQFLLQNINGSKDTVLRRLKNLLINYIKIIDWVRTNHLEEDTNRNMDTNSSSKMSVSSILSALQHSTPLMVLSMTINLHNQDYNIIVNLLEEFRDSKLIFQAYYCILCALKGIQLSVSYNIEHKVITNFYSEMLSILNKLFPLNLRLDTIKNIFSLLFIQHEDFTNAGSISEEEEYPELTICKEKMKLEKKPRGKSSTGFVCNKYAIRETLYYLYTSLLIAENENLETNCCESNEIKESILFLKEVLRDAKKRLELFTNVNFVAKIGIPDNICDAEQEKSQFFVHEKSVLSPRSMDNSFFYREIINALRETETESENNSEKDMVVNYGKRKKRVKNPSSPVGGVSKLINEKECLINYMLATGENLVLQCLWKSDYKQAREIIERSDAISMQLAKEVQLSEALQIYRRSIKRNPLNSENVKNSKKPFNSTLENIRLVAQEGFQTIKQTGKLETFLATQEAQLRSLGLNTDNNGLLTLSALDLAMTVSQAYETSSNLCDVAMNYLKSCEHFNDTEHDNFFSKIYLLLHENKEETMARILCDARTPLQPKEFKEKNVFWSDMLSSLKEFKYSEKKSFNDESDGYSLGLASLIKMSKFVSYEEFYLHSIITQLQLLHDIVPTTTGKNTTVCSLLKVPLHIYFGYQIFELHIQPEELEDIAAKLGINLAYSVLRTVCMNIECPHDSRKIINDKIEACVILNKTNNVDIVASNANISSEPNQCIAEILRDLLQVLSHASSGRSLLNTAFVKEIAKNTEVRIILEKTYHLTSLDLSVLSVGDETLTFFLNLWNVMFLHTILAVWVYVEEMNDLRHTISSMTVGYVVGDLGLVTLSSLRRKLLGDLSWESKWFSLFEELNEPAWQDLDLIHDSRVVFSMINEFRETPVISIYDPKTLNDDLNKSVTSYLDYYLSNNVDDGIIYFPTVVKDYQEFYSNDKNAFSISDYLKDHLKAVKYVSPTYSYEIKLKYNNKIVKHLQVTPTLEKQLQIVQPKEIGPNLLQYLERHCWIFSYLIQKFYNENPTILDNNCNDLERVTCIKNLLNSKWIETLEIFYNNNKTLTATQENGQIDKLWNHLNDLVKEKKWHYCLEILQAVSDNAILKNIEIQCLGDQVLVHLISDEPNQPSALILKYIFGIKNIHTLARTILYNINNWPVDISENILQHVLHHENSNQLPAHCKLRMCEILHKITIFRKILPYYTNKVDTTWYDVIYCTDSSEPLKVIKTLINADQYKLCLEWLECQTFSLEMQSLHTQDLLTGLLKNNKSKDFKESLKLLQVLPVNQSIKLCKAILNEIECVDALQFVTNFLLEHGKAVHTLKYRRTLIGIDILRHLENKERGLYIHLIKFPLLMLEQLLMNCKFECIQKILATNSEKLQQTNILIESFDKIIRFYAKKALDFRVSVKRDDSENISRDSHPSFLEDEGREFVMPAIAPTRDEWIPNDRVRQCPCCNVVIFSMFNRRHHCRRCGRVVCAVCSQHRMQVSAYPDSVLVRVCDDCKRQTQSRQETSTTQTSDYFEYWKLTNDQTHNRTIRDEFSFEYAPSISLCLAILNLHSDHQAYTSFLHDRCDEMKILLEPNNGVINPEIDHALIIKMIRSLLVAAKVKCAKLGLNSGLAHCDRFLSQVDLIMTLVHSDCLTLIPKNDLKDRVLRKLRDLLTEKEQWSLALNVSTKSGLDTQEGVWAAWGNACLKAGYLEHARNKFMFCLDKVLYDCADDWVILSYPKESGVKESNKEPNSPKKALEQTVDMSSQKKTDLLRNRPVKDPPLLTEILQILENLSINELVRSSNGSGNNIYYQESLYYLLMFGSYNSVLEFFVKHNEFEKCLTYVLDNDVEPEIFFNSVYMNCLKHGKVEKLNDIMKIKYPSLIAWKKYLVYICHNLEKKEYFHCLYQLQIFMQDYIRAAMTCIRFYINNANSYADLCSRADFLINAQKHLESELHIEHLSRKRRKSVVSTSGSQVSFKMEMEPSEIDKHINTICRQMEVAKFLMNAEIEGRDPKQLLNLFPSMDYDGNVDSVMPSLFGNQREKTHLAVLAILCGRNVEEGFGIAFRIMQDYNLRVQKVYSLAGHILALKNNITEIEQLIKCCRSSGAPNSHVISDHVLIHCVKLILQRLQESCSNSKDNIDILVRLIIDIELKISAYIESKQLKAAYLLAVKHSRAHDIRKILKESDRLGQNAIKTICTKWLEQSSKN